MDSRIVVADRIAAEELIATGVGAVINCSDSSNGRYPNSGPLLLTSAGIRLVDAPGAPLFDLQQHGALRDAIRARLT